MSTGYNMQPARTMDLKAVLGDVVYRAPGKNELEIRKAIGESAREFLKLTGVWKETRACAHFRDGWYGFKHGYINAQVLRIDAFVEGDVLQRMEGEPDGVAPIPCGIPMPRIGNPVAPTIAHFIEQGGYVLVAAPGTMPLPQIPPPYMPEDGSINPTMRGSYDNGEGVVVFTLGLAFGGEVMPESLIQQYGSVIADGAAHMLLAGPAVARSVYGDRFRNACDTLAMRMANGGVHAPIGGKIIDGMIEV